MAELVGTWKLDYSEERVRGRQDTEVPGVGVEWLEIFADGSFAQSFQTPDGVVHPGSRGTWRLFEDDHGPHLSMSDLMELSYGVEPFALDRRKPRETVLSLLPQSDLPFGKPKAWYLSDQNLDLDLAFSKVR